MLYFKDRIPDSLHGQNEIFLDAVDSAGALKLSDFKMIMKNTVQPGKEGTPLNAANMNFASGVADLPASGQITKGMLLSLNGGKVVPTKTPARPVAATQQNIVPLSFFQLSAVGIVSTYLMCGIYSSAMYMWVTTVDWSAGTVAFGPMYNTGQGTASFRFELVSPTLACMAFRNGNMTGNYYTTRFYTISGTTIIGGSYTSNAGDYDYGRGDMGQTRPVKCGADSVMLVSIDPVAGACNARLITSALTEYKSAAIPGITNVNQLKSLVSCDGGNSKYVLLYSGNTDGTGTLYTAVITVGGTTVTVAPAAQNVTGNITTIGYAGGVVSPMSNTTGRFIFSTLYDGGNMTIQPATITNTGFVTFGGKLSVPVVAGMADSPSLAQMTSIYTSTFVTPRGDGSVYIAGVSGATSWKHKFVDVSADFFNPSFSEYVPFKFQATASDYYFTRCMAIECPYIPGLYVFVENTVSGYTLSAQNYFFGYEADLPNPNNMIGIALDASANGFVKVQISGKLLPGILSGLSPGVRYMAGTNGSLAVYDGSSPAVGIAVNSTDFLFMGAVWF